MSDMEITTQSHGLKTGDVITMPIRLGWWARFLLWVADPFRWPPKTWDGRYVVTETAGKNSFQIERDVR